MHAVFVQLLYATGVGAGAAVPLSPEVPPAPVPPVAAVNPVDEKVPTGPPVPVDPGVVALAPSAAPQVAGGADPLPAWTGDYQ